MGITAHSDISIEDARHRISSSEVFLLDVRTPEECQLGTLPTAVTVPHDQLGEKLDLLPTDKNKEIFCYCRSGARSDFAAKYLRAQGYTNVVNIGGYEDLR